MTWSWTSTSSAVVGSSAMTSSWAAGERRRDRRALEHAARQLVRIAPEDARGIGHAEPAEQVRGARFGLVRAQAVGGARAAAAPVGPSAAAGRRHGTGPAG